MKSIKKTYFSVILSFLLMITGGVFLNLPQSKSIANAEEEFTPSYLSVCKYDVDNSGENPVYEKVGSEIQRKDAIFVDENQVVILNLANPAYQSDNAILYYSMQIFVNNESVSLKPEYIQDYPDSSLQYIEVILDLHSASQDPEGKYNITISYMEYTKIAEVFTNAIIRDLSYDFYLYKTSTYYSAEQPSVNIQNVDTYLAGSSASYAKTHEFYYDNNLELAQSLNLPTISYSVNKFELLITKNISGTSQTTRITLDENDNLTQTNNIVLISKDGEIATVTFNDIGNYTIQYVFVYNGENGIEYFENVNATSKPDKMNIFGLQLFHSDINSVLSGQKSEFKVIDQNNTIDPNHQTDITYSQINDAYQEDDLLESYTTINPENENEDLYVIDSSNFTAIDFNAQTLSPSSTNQAPVDFNYNTSIIHSLTAQAELADNSFYLKLNTEVQNDNFNVWEKFEGYNGTAFTDVGIYIVKATYTSQTSYISGQRFTQWFYFEITNETPSFNVSNELGNSISSNTFTKDNISVEFTSAENPFDSESKLMVYSKAYTESAYTNFAEISHGQSTIFDTNNNYKVVLQFGKNLSKSKISYFTIDNTAITGITARNVELTNGYQTKTDAVNFFTNQNAAVEWNEKAASGNTVTAFYKFIPIVSKTSSYDTTELESFYAQDYSVPVQYYLDYSPIVGHNYDPLSSIPYSNTAGQESITTESLFTEQGLYIFYLADKAGNDAYYSFVIDKTKPVVLQKMIESGAYLTDFSTLNLIAEDAIVQWGRYKVIKTDISLANLDLNSWTPTDASSLNIDPWLLKVLREKATLSQLIGDPDSDFKLLTVNSVENIYLSPRIDTSNVKIQIGDVMTFANNTSYGGGRLLDPYSYQISIADANDSSVLYENSYNFYVSDESNTTTSPSTIHSIQVSTDISKTSVRFESTQTTNAYDSLIKHSYEVTDEESSIKNTFYMPISNNILQLQYLIAPEENSIEVDKIVVKYYEYLSNYLIFKGASNDYLTQNMYYTLQEELTYTGATNATFTNGEDYTLQEFIDGSLFTYSQFEVGQSIVLAKEPVDITVYDYSNQINLGSLSGSMYVWNINTIVDQTTGNTITKQGKYTVERTYRQDLANIQDIVGERYDFMTRKITFILDRQDIVTTPITLNIETNPNQDANYVLVSQVGGSAYVEVLYGSYDAGNKFTEIYRAKNYSANTQTSILETNKLPVKISIPLFKFGEMINSNFAAFTNNMFYSDDMASYIDSFELMVNVKHLQTGNTTTNSYSLQLTQIQPSAPTQYITLGNGYYLVTNGIENGFISLPTFNTAGQYQVTLSQNNQNLKGDKASLTFYFNIINVAPTFELEDTSGNILSYSSNDVYYTNKNTLRVKWTDSSNYYMAKIDRSNLQYYDGYQTITVASSNIVTLDNGYTHYFDVNLANYPDATQITVSLSYEGNSEDYIAGSFTTHKTIEIDRIAPTQSLNNLFELAGEEGIINSSNLREGHANSLGYNKTTTEQSSIFKNYAFAIDITDFESLIMPLNDKIELRYKQVSNKYTDASYQELDPSNTSALTQVRYGNDYISIMNESDIAQLDLNTYYEIVEIDIADNITVYSIYLTDVNSFIEEEQTLEEENYEYKQELNDDYKVVSFDSQTINNSFVSVLDLYEDNYSSYVYSTGNFTLNTINPYNYGWSIVTYNNVKYVYAPQLNGTAYKWTASGTEEVDLSQIINLPVSNFTYTVKVTNAPKNNFDLNVVVSNSQLNIEQPTLESEQITITQIAANSDKNVVWETATIWEYRQGSTTAYRYAKFANGIEEPIDYSPEIEGFNLAAYTTNELQTTFVVNGIVGSHYRYKVTDNFGNIYTFHHLFGQSYVEPITSLDNTGSLQTDTIEDTTYYVNNQGFTYSYYPSITTVTLTIYRFDSNSGIGWDSQVLTYTINATTTIDSRYASITKYSSYYTINMNPNLSTNEDFDGEMIVYNISATTNILSEESESATETEEYNFKVYNLSPRINLKGKNRQSLNDLLDNSANLTSEPITIEFADTQNFEYPVLVYVSYEDQPEVLIQSGTTFSQAGTYYITRVYTGVMSAFEIEEKQFTISDSAWQFYTVVAYSQVEGDYVEVQATGLPYITDSSGSNEATSIYQHYIVNTTDFLINVNSSQYVEVVGAPGTPTQDENLYYTDIKSGVSTYVRTLSNYQALDNSSINYFETKIAITYIPKAEKVLNTLYYMDSQGYEIDLNNSEATYTLEKDVDSADSVIVTWNNYYLITENKVIVEVRYGEDNTLIQTQITTNNSYDSIKLTRSGNYLFTFSDLAGNTHKFDYSASIQNSTTSYDFIFLKNVVFTVNDEAPIPFAIYNQDVEIQIPSYTISYYDYNARPTINVLRNGEEYSAYNYKVSDRVFTFTETGLYKVVFTAKRNEVQVREEAFYFQIIKSNEITWAFDVEQYQDYYIEQIIKNEQDVTSDLTNASMGNLITITKDGVSKQYLRNLFISLYDEQTGAGYWQVKINTNNDLMQSFTYAFRVSNVTPPITVSLEEGQETTDVIYISFNALNLYEEVGDAIIRIGTQKEIILNEEYFEDSEHVELYNIELTRLGDSFIQILTPSERLLYSYKVTRNEPLNAVSILIIIVSSATSVGLAVMFTLLRRRMKIR